MNLIETKTFCLYVCVYLFLSQQTISQTIKDDSEVQGKCFQS
jgi:hypothetical protein